jgi:hypothetical protein
MDESTKMQLIRAAKTGKLTEDQYKVYLKLLEEDPDFREQVEWEDLLDKTLPVSMNAKLYAAADEHVFPVRRKFFEEYRYAVAATVTLLLVAGWLTFYFGFRNKEPEMVASRTIELYSGDNKPEGQLGYTEGDMPAGNVALQWYSDEDQQAGISYRFCADTLRLYFRQPADTLAFNAVYKLTYFTETQQYFLEAKNKARIQLDTCQEPKPLPE